MVTLQKPPIVEMWIEFTFEPWPKSSPGTAVVFLQRHAGEYPELELTQEGWLEFREVPSRKLPEVVSKTVAIKHIRARTTDGSRWLQLTPTQLVCNFLKLGDSYPGFAALSAEAVAKLASYVEACRPTKLLGAAIHYVDVIDVPVPEAGEILLRDYFTLGIDLPDVFGLQGDYLLKTAASPRDGTGPLEIQLLHDIQAARKEALRFRMDWHKSCPYNKDVQPGAILALLQAAHASVMGCFRAAFTERAWQLFSPNEA